MLKESSFQQVPEAALVITRISRALLARITTIIINNNNNNNKVSFVNE